MRAAGARAAYSFQPSENYSALWFNESEADPSIMSPVAEILPPEEAAAAIKDPEKLVLLDVA